MAQDEPESTVPSLRTHAVDAAIVRERVRAELFGGEFSAPRLGRFSVLERIGQGGMGIVFAGYDAELDRKVAIKVIRRDGARDRVRLLREARAMAQLSDPHVVSVYEVGEHDDRVWIAMEFVAGITLARWVAAEPRPWRQTLAAFVQAARGLQAAHARGLVHRDFKPDNALVSTDGIVKVVDFGLARAVTSTTASDDDPPRSVDIDDPANATSITSSGALAGTPGYMAPEQFESAVIDARADQFAFCVGLWEALYGEPPFPRDSFAALVVAVQAGKVRSPSPSTKVPARIERALRRGLSPRPDDRFVDMAALVHALQSEPLRRARGIALASVALVATAAAAYGFGRGERASPCSDVSEL
ncbi:MAG TPA: serine/threonine-protein kinase, partial [Nannocystaceae bacterium]|nr:serine/threonine-protein kinase [Nannocystaceae bacterium]